MAAAEIRKKIILEKISEEIVKKGTITKVSLKRALSYNDSEFEEAFDLGVLNLTIDVRKHNYLGIKNPYSVKEEDYYECIEGMLQGLFDRSVGKNGNFFIERTARRESKIAGRWTRPDFTIISNRKFPYIKEAEFDIFTFEVKRPADCDTLAVFEALAHSTVATRSFVFFPITEADFNKSTQAGRIKEECGRHGVGLILVTNGARLDECRILIDSQRRSLNPEKSSNFLQSVLDKSSLAELARW